MNVDTRLINVLNKMQFPKNGKMLDLGCDKGSLIFELEKYGFSQLIGIDNNDEFEEDLHFFVFLYQNEVIKATDNEGYYKFEDKEFTYWEWLEFKDTKFLKWRNVFQEKFSFFLGKKKGDICEYKIMNNEFDLIVASKVFHFLEEEEEQVAIRKIYDGLKTDGLFYMTVNNLEASEIPNHIDTRQISKYKFVNEKAEYNKFILYDLERIKKSLQNFKIIKEHSRLGAEDKLLQVLCLKE